MSPSLLSIFPPDGEYDLDNPEYSFLKEMTPDQVSRRLNAYGAETLDDLTEEAAGIIISKFEEALSKQGKTTESF